ncbi:hypothetical protein PHYC_01748 [Phycisphaerales bacterium]|nr:hypothetical protein PHYC_01748 [Phycisphaerales bacterium]
MLPFVALCLLAQPAPDKAGSLVPFPHPLITEVLFNVPPGAEGDADGDGIRSATGDEFVELVNPHGQPISLKGYILADGKNAKRPAPPPRPNQKNPKPDATTPEKDSQPPKPQALPDDNARVTFAFPDITLQPGQVVVVFNGYTGDAAPKVPGESPAAPASPPKPGEKPEAVRLSMNINSQFAAFGNNGDCVSLTAPDGKPVQCITWGLQPKTPDDFAPLIEHAPEGRFRGSVTRVAMTKGLIPHRDQTGDLKGLLYSPGVWEAAPSKK